MKKILYSAFIACIALTQYACTNVDQTVVPDLASTVVGTYTGTFSLTTVEIKRDTTLSFGTSTLTGLSLSNAVGQRYNTVTGTNTISNYVVTTLVTTTIGGVATTLNGAFISISEITNTISATSQKVMVSKLANKQVALSSTYSEGSSLNLNLTGFQLAPTLAFSSGQSQYTSTSATYNPSTKVLFYSLTRTSGVKRTVESFTSSVNQKL